MNEVFLLIGLGALVYIMIGHLIARMGGLKGTDRITITVFWLPIGIFWVLALAVF